MFVKTRNFYKKVPQSGNFLLLKCFVAYQKAAFFCVVAAQAQTSGNGNIYLGEHFPECIC